jgi:hypothetical protein
MAEYIKFRLTAAKASVTLAFLALLGGLPGVAQGKQESPSAKAASFQWGDPIYLKLDGITGATQKVFSTLEHKINTALSSLSHKINTSFYDKHKIDTTFLKIQNANKLYYKQSQVNANFLKIEDANTSFLTITDANKQFLTVGGTAANSSELGGMTPDAFVQGHANVLTGTVQLNGDGKPQTVIAMADGSVRVDLLVNVDGTEIIVVHNGTSAPLTGVADPTAVEFSAAPGQDARINAGRTTANPNVSPPTDGSLMTHIQIFPNGVFKNVATLTVSSEPQTQGLVTAVAQILVGL